MFDGLLDVREDLRADACQAEIGNLESSVVCDEQVGSLSLFEGPDQEGKQHPSGKYPDSWHFLHMQKPVSTSPGSLMPAYTWIYKDKLDDSDIEGKIITLRRLGVPYPAGYERQAQTDLRAQAATIAAGLKGAGFDASADREIIALIAYLQRLGPTSRRSPRRRRTCRTRRVKEGL